MWKPIGVSLAVVGTIGVIAAVTVAASGAFDREEESGVAAVTEQGKTLKPEPPAVGASVGGRRQPRIRPAQGRRK